MSETNEDRPAEVEAQGARELWERQKAHIPEGELDDAWIADFAEAYAASEREARKKAELVIAARNIELRQARELPTALMEVIRKHDHCKADRSCLQAIEVFVQAFLSPAAQEK